MKSPSRLPTSRAPRGGFTLIEMLVACAITSLVMGMAFRSFIDANKAKSTAIASGVLKSAGQVAVNDIYKNLHMSRHLFDRNAITNTFIGRLPIAGCNVTGTATCSPGVTAGDLLLPQIQLTGSFMAQNASGTANANFSAASVGNALFFAAQEPKVILKQTGTQNDLSAVFSSTTYYVSAYRLHFYFLTRRPLPSSLAYRGTDHFDYQLMHWVSQPYIDYKDLVLFFKKLEDYSSLPTLSPTANSFIDTKMTNLSAAFAGAIDLTSVDAGTTATLPAVYRLTANAATHRDLMPDTTNLFKTYRYATALNFSMRGSFGEPMVAFNTYAGTTPSPVPSFYCAGIMNPGVPAYASQTNSTPFGFETMIAGPPDAREVLARLTVAAVTTPGNVKVGEAFQQVIQTYDY